MITETRNTQFMPKVDAIRTPRYAIRATQDARRVNYAKQTQFPGHPNEHKACHNKTLRQFPPPRTLQKQTQSNPISEKPK